MAQVKFFRGLFEKYVATEAHKDAIYFSTDTNELLLNGISYGVSKTDLEKLDASVKGIELNDGVLTVSYTGTKAASTITLPLASTTANGLMSKDDKAALDLLNGAVGTTGSVKEQVNTALEAAKTYANDLVKEGSALDLRIDALEGAIGESGAVADQIKTAIEGLDVDAIGGTGKIVTTVSEADGKISAEVIDATAANIAIANTELTATNVEAALAEIISEYKEADSALSTKIQEVSDNAKSYEIVAVTEGLEANVKEAFKLVDEDGTQAGELIKVYKDSALQSAVLGKATVDEVEQDCLILTYLDVNGAEQVVNIPVGDFLREAEFKNGLEVKNGEVHVKIDALSESFLTVSENGIKLSGIQNAIEGAIDEVEKVIEDNEKVTAQALTDLDGRVLALEGNQATIDGALQASDITTGSNNGTIAVKGTDVAVKGLGSAAYTDASAYATAQQAADALAAAQGAQSHSEGVAGDLTEYETANDARVKAVEDSLLEAGTVGAKIKANADAIAVLNGTEAGSVSKAVADAKATIDAYTVNGKAISTSPVLKATDITLGTYTSVDDNNINITASTTLADAIKALEDAWTWGEA